MPETSAVSVQDFLQELERELMSLPVHSNSFFQAFQRGVTRDQLVRFIRQWYRFGIEFRKILIGLLYNICDQDEAIGLELVRVLYSEYGEGKSENVHANQILQLAGRLGIEGKTLAGERLCPEAQSYIDVVGGIYLTGDLPSALGAAFGVETTAGLTYRYLYGGLLTFQDLSLQDIRFFETHLFEELQHGDWLRTAVINYASLNREREKVRNNAMLAMEKWHGLWNGIHRLVLDQ